MALNWPVRCRNIAEPGSEANWGAEEGINRMLWPAKSPDLNPLEHLWGHLKYRVDKRIKPTTTLIGLEQILRREWAAIDQGRIRRLVNSMRQRCLAVIQAEGSHTRY